MPRHYPDKFGPPLGFAVYFRYCLKKVSSFGSVIFRYSGWSYKSTCVAPGTTNSSFGSAAFSYASSEKYFDTAFSPTMKSNGRGRYGLDLRERKEVHHRCEARVGVIAVELGCWPRSGLS